MTLLRGETMPKATLDDILSEQKRTNKLLEKIEKNTRKSTVSPPQVQNIEIPLSPIDKGLSLGAINSLIK